MVWIKTSLFFPAAFAKQILKAKTTQFWIVLSPNISWSLLQLIHYCPVITSILWKFTCFHQIKPSGVGKNSKWFLWAWNKMPLRRQVSHAQAYALPHYLSKCTPQGVQQFLWWSDGHSSLSEASVHFCLIQQWSTHDRAKEIWTRNRESFRPISILMHFTRKPLEYRT